MTAYKRMPSRFRRVVIMFLFTSTDSVVGIVRSREGALVIFWLGGRLTISRRTSSVEFPSSRSVPRDAGSSRTTLECYRKMIGICQDRNASKILTGVTRASCIGHSSSSVRRTESALLITIKAPTTLLDKLYMR